MTTEGTYRRIGSEPNMEDISQPSPSKGENNRMESGRAGENEERQSLINSGGEDRSSGRGSISGRGSGDDEAKQNSGSTRSIEKQKTGTCVGGDKESLLSFRGELKREEKLRVIPCSVLVVFVLSIICLLVLLVLSTFNYVRICKLESNMRQNIHSHDPTASPAAQTSDHTTTTAPQDGRPVMVGFESRNPSLEQTTPRQLSVDVNDDNNYTTWEEVKDYVDTEIAKIKALLNDTTEETRSDMYTRLNEILLRLNESEELLRLEESAAVETNTQPTRSPITEQTTDMLTTELLTTEPLWTEPVTETTTTTTMGKNRVHNAIYSQNIYFHSTLKCAFLANNGITAKIKFPLSLEGCRFSWIVPHIID